MTSLVNTELKAVLSEIYNGRIVGAESIVIRTYNGRKYEVCCALETPSGEWIATAGRIKGYYRCSKCPSKLMGIPGGNWYQVTLKNGVHPEPVVRLHEICIHNFENHPEALAELETDEKCIRVFGSSVGLPSFNPVDIQEKAKAFIDANLFGGKRGYPLIHLACIYLINDLKKYINDVISNPDFQKDPKTFVAEWIYRSSNTADKIKMPEAQALDFFENYYFNQG